ncbi:MAG: helix-turn-helix transcriptional regulator, partial [Clostridia bacterium]|nr:helix-turn-helix transcriptional regulator [Clostridia bacterium]
LFTDSKKEDSLSYFDFGNQFDSLDDFARFLKNYDRSENVLDIEEVTERIHGYIALNYAQNISVNMLSEKFFVSPGYLNRSFKKKYGITINKFITDVRMNKAMELINSANNLTLLKISQMVGYSDFYYFSRVFKKNFERAPSFYKNQ